MIERLVGFIKNNRSLIRELFLYGVIGLFSASMDTLSYFLLRKLGCPLALSNFIGVNLGIGISFFLNTFINFRKTGELLRRAIRFFAVGYFGMLISFVILKIGVEIAGLSELIVKPISVIIVALIQYLLNKFITYRG